MKRVLILGANGNLGGQLIKIFDNDYNIVAWDRGEIDITDRELIMNKVRDLKPDIIINVAAYNAVDKCEDDDKEYALAQKVNGEAPGFLADAALSVDALLIHYSSDYVFDGNKENGYDEKEETKSINKYGETKIDGEKAVIERSGRGLKWYLIRTSKLFGPKGLSVGAKDSFFDLILKLSEGRKEFNMVDGEEISCFTYTLDLARATKKLIEEDYGYGIYHITNTGASSWYDAAKLLFEIKKINDIKLNPIKSSDYPRPAKRPKFSVLNNNKFGEMRSWKEALREYSGD